MINGSWKLSSARRGASSQGAERRDDHLRAAGADSGRGPCSSFFAGNSGNNHSVTEP